MRSGEGNTLYYEGGVKYLPRGSLEVRSTERSEILMDYGMIGPLLPVDVLNVIPPYRLLSIV